MQCHRYWTELFFFYHESCDGTLGESTIVEWDVPLILVSNFVNATMVLLCGVMASFGSCFLALMESVDQQVVCYTQNTNFPGGYMTGLGASSGR